MTRIEELHQIVKLLKKHDLPLSPILEYAIKEREEQYAIEANGAAVLREDDPVFDVYKELVDYEKEFSNMSVGVSKGRKLPHKAILLLSLMNLIETGIITYNRFDLNSIIVNAFANSWNLYFTTKAPNVWTPFYHLKGETFWHFKGYGNEEMLKNFLSFGGTPSIGKMRQFIQYAYLDDPLFEYMKDESARTQLTTVLIETYIK